MKVTTVEVKDVELPTDMQRAIARQAEAERERRAKIIAADGEFQAAEKLSQAANIISQNPATLQLRYLQTLLDIGVNQNSTIVFPLPLDMVKPFVERGAEPRRSAASLEHAGAADRTRGPHRPAHGAAGHPRPGPGGSPGRVRPRAGPDPRRERRTRARSARAARTAPRPRCGPSVPTAGARFAGLDGPGGAESLPGARRRHDVHADAEPESGFSSSVDPLRASTRAREPDLFASQPADGAHEVIVHAPEHVTSMAELARNDSPGRWRPGASECAPMPGPRHSFT